MRKLVITAVCTLLIASVPAVAQTPSAHENTVDAHARLLDTIQSSVTPELSLDSTMRALDDQLRLDATMTELERRKPGTITAICEASRPVMERYVERVKAIYRPRFLQAMGDHLTPAEAEEIAGFFASPIGRKVLRSTVENFRTEAMGQSVADGEAVTPADVRHDSDAATQVAISSLTDAELVQLNREIAARPAMQKLAAVRGQITSLRAQMEQEPMTSSEQQALRAAVEAVLTGRTFASRPAG